MASIYCKAHACKDCHHDVTLKVLLNTAAMLTVADPALHALLQPVRGATV